MALLWAQSIVDDPPRFVAVVRRISRHCPAYPSSLPLFVSADDVVVGVSLPLLNLRTAVYSQQGTAGLAD